MRDLHFFQKHLFSGKTSVATLKIHSLTNSPRKVSASLVIFFQSMTYFLKMVCCLSRLAIIFFKFSFWLTYFYIDCIACFISWCHFKLYSLFTLTNSLQIKQIVLHFCSTKKQICPTICKNSFFFINQPSWLRKFN